jgi:hypothetical protein
MISAIAHNRPGTLDGRGIASRAFLTWSAILLAPLFFNFDVPVVSAETKSATTSNSGQASSGSEHAADKNGAIKADQPTLEELSEAPSIQPALYVSDGQNQFRRIGPTAIVTEVTSGFPFPARVDTGATSCAIHCAKFVIEDPALEPAENVGKPIRILLENHEGEQKWIKTKVAGHVVVRTTTDNDERYKVPIKLRWQDVEKKVLVTLSDRAHMTYPLLLGRNFLNGDFIVDVALDADH